MRLLHTTTIKLSSFNDDDSIPPYAILSHTWGNAEISLHDLLNYAESKLEESEGYKKISSCCALAAIEGYEYVWIDTCCIDKTSSAELTEAINSMYCWYQGAQKCYVYLADVCIGDDLEYTMAEKAFGQSRWFTRGWTLQELLAPKNLFFYDQNWRKLGSKSSLMLQISSATGILINHIHDINDASIAQKMSWASNRQTSRKEDMAYSLMGIFDVNMPLLYGEGKKAFTRLQHEIVKISNDESIFAWRDVDFVESGLFAQSPKAFAESGNVFQIASNEPDYVYRAPYTVTNRGLAIEAWAIQDSLSTFILDRGFAILPLNCARRSTRSFDQIAIELEKVSRDEFVRFSPGKLDRLQDGKMDHLQRQADKRSMELTYVRSGLIPRTSHEQRVSLFINKSSISNLSGRWVLEISSLYNCRLVQDRGPPSKEDLSRIMLGSDDSFATVGLTCRNGPFFGIVVHSAGRKLSVLSRSKDLGEEIRKHEDGRDCRCSTDPAPIQLEVGRWVSMVLREKQVGISQRHYLLEIVPTDEKGIPIPQKSENKGERRGRGIGGADSKKRKRGWKKKSK